MITESQFMALATLALCNDQPADVEDVDVPELIAALDSIANDLGYLDWVDAYHSLQV